MTTQNDIFKTKLNINQKTSVSNVNDRMIILVCLSKVSTT